MGEMKDGRSAKADGLSQAAPEVAALRASIPSADDRIDIGGESVLRFHPTWKRIKDGTLRCISCGQIDEDGWHEAAYCPGSGGAIPFATSALSLKLKADSGYRAKLDCRLHLEQWAAINHIINSDVAVSRAFIASAMSARSAETAGLSPKDASAVGAAETPNLSDGDHHG